MAFNNRCTVQSLKLHKKCLSLKHRKYFFIVNNECNLLTDDVLQCEIVNNFQRTIYHRHSVFS